MGDTSIGWTHRPGTRGRTWNVTRGCDPVSPGCALCYAASIAARFSGPGLAYEGLATLDGGRPRWTGEGRFIPGKLAEPLRWREPSTVFVNSMSDLFFEAFTFEEIAAIYGVMVLAERHTFQILTKRPERAKAFFEWLSEGVAGFHYGPRAAVLQYAKAAGVPLPPAPPDDPWLTRGAWPPENVWLGVSAERQEEWDERVPVLRELPAAIRFVSQEPALGPITYSDPRLALEGIDWLIWGGESGRGARPANLDWAVYARYQCEIAGVAFFMKQAGERAVVPRRQFETFTQWVNKASTWILPGDVCFDLRGRRCQRGSDFMRARAEDAFPVLICSPVELRDKKGEHLADLPEGLRVREWPRTERRAAA